MIAMVVVEKLLNCSFSTCNNRIFCVLPLTHRKIQQPFARLKWTEARSATKWISSCWSINRAACCRLMWPPFAGLMLTLDNQSMFTPVKTISVCGPMVKWNRALTMSGSCCCVRLFDYPQILLMCPCGLDICLAHPSGLFGTTLTDTPQNYLNWFCFFWEATHTLDCFGSVLFHPFSH